MKFGIWYKYMRRKNVYFMKLLPKWMHHDFSWCGKKSLNSYMFIYLTLKGHSYPHWGTESTNIVWSCPNFVCLPFTFIWKLFIIVKSPKNVWFRKLKILVVRFHSMYSVFLALAYFLLWSSSRWNSARERAHFFFWEASLVKTKTVFSGSLVPPFINYGLSPNSRILSDVHFDQFWGSRLWINTWKKTGMLVC